MKSRALFLIIILCISLTAVLQAEQLSKIAVIDFSKLIENFPSKSRAFEKLNLLRQEYDEKTDEYLIFLNSLEISLINAKERDNDLQVANIEREITAYRAFINEYQRIKLKEIEIQQSEFLKGKEVAEDIYQAINYISINEQLLLI